MRIRLRRDPNDDPVTVVHLAAELAPFARTGGLGEAVSSLAHYQARSGIKSIIMMPLYKQVIEVATDLQPVGDPFPVIVGPRHEAARIYESRALMDNPRQGKPRILFIHNAEYFGRDQIYGDSQRRLSRQPSAFRVLLPGGTEHPAEGRHRPGAAARARLARGAGADLPAGVRLESGSRVLSPHVQSVLTVHNAGFQGHFSDGRDGRARAAVGVCTTSRSSSGTAG